jgi:hypothetical protein
MISVVIVYLGFDSWPPNRADDRLRMKQGVIAMFGGDAWRAFCEI